MTTEGLTLCVGVAEKPSRFRSQGEPRLPRSLMACNGGSDATPIAEAWYLVARGNERGMPSRGSAVRPDFIGTGED